MTAAPVLLEDTTRSAEGAPEATIQLRSAFFPLILRLPDVLDDDRLLQFCAENHSLRSERNAEGDLILMTPAGGMTGNREAYHFRELDVWVERHSKGVAFNSDAGFSLSDGSVRVPDAAWVSNEKWQGLSEAQREKFLPACPEFVIELRSASDRVPDLEARREFWMSRGAVLGWLIDPQRRLAAIYRPGREPEITEQPEFLQGEGPVACFSLKMRRLWE